MPISIARKIAYETLRRVEAEGAYASDVLHVELGPSIKPADAALATELTMGVPLVTRDMRIRSSGIATIW